MERSLSREYYTPQILRCDSRQEVELHTAHTKHQDEGSYSQQHVEEISLLEMGNKCMHYKNNDTGLVLLNSRICCSSMGEIYADILDPELNKACRAIP